eukprot:g16502.t1
MPPVSGTNLRCKKSSRAAASYATTRGVEPVKLERKIPAAALKRFGKRLRKQDSDDGECPSSRGRATNRGPANKRPKLDVGRSKGAGGAGKSDSNRRGSAEDCHKRLSSLSSAQAASASKWVGWEDKKQKTSAKQWHLDTLRKNLPQKTQEVLSQWLQNKRQHWYCESSGEDKHRINIENLASEFAAELAPQAFGAVFSTSPTCRHVTTRLETDGTSRETRGQDRRVNRSAKWLATLVTAWLSNFKIPPRFWPRWSYLPSSLFNTKPGKDLPEGLSPSERNARIAVDTIWPYIAALSHGCSVTPILAGDAAESSTITIAIALLDAKIRAERPDLIFLPWAQRCSVHQATICGEECAQLFCQLRGTSVSIFQNKLYLQVLQKRKQGDKYSKLIAQQAEDSVFAMDEQEYTARKEKVGEYQTFLRDMGCSRAANDFKGAVPVLEVVQDEDGNSEERHSVRVRLASLVKAVKEGWKKLYQKLREPRFSRWLTFGPAARREAIHESLSAVLHICKKKPWFFSKSEWKEFKLSPQLDQHYVAMKLLLGHLFRPLDIIVELVLSLAGCSATTTELEEKGSKAFRAQSTVLLDAPRIATQIDFASMNSRDLSDAQKDELRLDAYVALLASCAAFVWRITSGARDLHDLLLTAFREAERLDDPAHNSNPNADPLYHRKKVMKQLFAYKTSKKKLPNEPGSVCLLAIATSLESMPIEKAVHYFSELSACLILSPSHQAGVERLIALAKHEQQGCFHNHRGQLRLNAAVIRRKHGNAYGVCKAYEADGSEDEVGPDDGGEGADEIAETDGGGGKDGEVSFRDMLSDADRRLFDMKISPSWYFEYLSAEKREKPFQPQQKGAKADVDAEDMASLQGLAQEQKKRRLELLLEGAEHAKRAEWKQTDAAFRRAKRAKLQLRFYEKLMQLVYEKFTKGGKPGMKSTAVGGWTYKQKLAEIANRLYTNSDFHWKFEGDAKFRVCKFASSGVERFCGWVVASQLGKKKYSEFEKYWDTEEREDEWDELEKELGDQGDMKPAFDGLRAVMAIELPELPNKPETEGGTLLVMLGVERSPFQFVAAPAERVAGSASQIKITDIIRTDEPWLSILSRPLLRKYNRKPGTLFSIRVRTATTEEITAEIVWKKSVVFPSQTASEDQAIKVKADAAPEEGGDGGGGIEAAKGVVAAEFDNEAAAVKAADAARRKAAAKGVAVVRTVNVEFEDSDEEKQQKKEARQRKKEAKAKMQPMRKAVEGHGVGGLLGNQGSSSSSNPNGQGGSSRDAKAGGKSKSASGLGEDSELSSSFEEDSEGEEPMKQYLFYNMNSDAERKEYVRRAQLAMLTGGGCEVEGFSADVVSVCQVKVQALDPDAQYLLQELPKLKGFKFDEWLCMRGRKGCRRFYYHPKAEGWKWAWRLGNLWAKRIDLTMTGPRNRRAKGALGKRAKRKMATKKKLDEATILRRINKLAGSQKSIPTGACWTSATLPIALRSCAKQYYVQFGTQVARANAKIVIDPVWKGAVAKLVFKYNQGGMITDCDKVDGATNLYCKFAKGKLAKNDLTSADWKVQTDGMIESIDGSDPTSCKNALCKMNKELPLGGTGVVQWLEVLIFTFLSVIARGSASLDAFQDWHTCAGYSFLCFAKVMTVVKAAKNSKKLMTKLWNMKKHLATAPDNPSASQKFWIAMVPKMCRSFDVLTLRSRVTIFLIKKGVVRQCWDDDKKKWVCPLISASDGEGGKAKLLESPMREMASKRTPASKEQQPTPGSAGGAASSAGSPSLFSVSSNYLDVGANDDEDYAKTSLELVGLINQLGSSIADQIACIFGIVFEGLSLDSILELDIDQFWWITEENFKGLNCADLLLAFKEEIEAASTEFLGLYWLWKAKDAGKAVIGVCGAGVLKKVGSAQWKEFLGKVNQGKVAEFEDDMEALQKIDSDKQIYCNKLRIVVESLVDLLPLDTYEMFVDKAKDLSAMWKSFDEDGICEEVIDALEGFIHQAIITLHANNFQEIKKHFDANDIEEAYALYQECHRFEDAAENEINIVPIWQDFDKSEAGRAVDQYEKDNGLGAYAEVLAKKMKKKMKNKLGDLDLDGDDEEEEDGEDSMKIEDSDLEGFDVDDGEDSIGAADRLGTPLGANDSFDNVLDDAHDVLGGKGAMKRAGPPAMKNDSKTTEGEAQAGKAKPSMKSAMKKGTLLPTESDEDVDMGSGDGASDEEEEDSDEEEEGSDEEDESSDEDEEGSDEDGREEGADSGVEMEDGEDFLDLSSTHSSMKKMKMSMAMKVAVSMKMAKAAGKAAVKAKAKAKAGGPKAKAGVAPKAKAKASMKKPGMKMASAMEVDSEASDEEEKGSDE